MIKFNKSLQTLGRMLLTALIVTLLWLPWASSTHAAVVKGENDPTAKPSATSERVQAFAECLPEELTLNNRDVGDRVARALGEMTNDQVERAFDFTNSPSLSEAEKEFQNCLNRKSVIPARQLADS